MSGRDGAEGTPSWGSVAGTAARVLAFRAGWKELASLGPRHLALGVVATWLVGIGRYWDHPQAQLAQVLGLGSVLVAAVLTGVLWLAIRPLRPAPEFSVANLGAFVGLTAPLAALYAIPVERFMPLQRAALVNAWFLAVVAVWRVALLVFYVRRLARLSLLRTAVAVLLPLTGVVTALALLNLERAAFDLMSGNLAAQTSGDFAYRVVFVIALYASILFPVPAAGWAAFVAVDGWRWWRARAKLPRPGPPGAT